MNDAPGREKRHFLRPDLQADYRARINRVIDYINAHLDAPLSLERLAALAAFSPFHFHRIFAAIVGEPLGTFIKRVRLEAAAARLHSNPSMAITTIALDCGYANSAAFARAFKEHFGCSASQWRRQGRRGTGASKIGIRDRKMGKDFAADLGHDADTTHGASYSDLLDARHVMTLTVRFEDLPSYRVAYARALGPYDVSAGRAWESLCRWAGPRGLLRPDSVWIGISYDDPSITPAEKLRYDACVNVPESQEAEGEIGVLTIPGGRHLVAHYRGNSAGIAAAYGEIYGVELPKHQMQPAESAAYERYLAEPQGDFFDMEICVPVKGMHP